MNQALMHTPSVEHPDAGQAALTVVLMLSLFLVAALGFGIDLTNALYHRQQAVAAADAACEAGASDLLAVTSGEVLSSVGFTAGLASDCVASPLATMCAYARLNGYNGIGLNPAAASNAVSWNFPSLISNVLAGPGAHPFLTVTITENVPTYFMGILLGSHVQQVSVSSTCGITQVQEAAPMVVLNPVTAGAFSYSGGGTLDIVGGPSRGLQVNSINPAAIIWQPSGMINLSAGGASQTGSSVGVVGGPAAAPTNGSANGFNGGATGVWNAGVLPVLDPYALVPPPSSIRLVTPSTTALGRWVAYGVDGCPDHSGGTGNPAQACMEYGPGFYPFGLTLLNNYSTAIFLPGVYYLNGSLTASGSNTLRVAKPSGYQQTDGVMFYFLTGSLNLSGCTGCASSGVNNVNATDLSCDGSSPPVALGMPTTLSGNVLYGQCTNNGTYWDSGGDTLDSRGIPGSRGLLVFEDHADLAQPALTGSGALSFAGSLYFHSSLYSDTLSLSGGSSSGTFILGEIIADQVNLSGSGAIKLALSGAKSTYLSKIALIN